MEKGDTVPLQKRGIRHKSGRFVSFSFKKQYDKVSESLKNRQRKTIEQQADVITGRRICDLQLLGEQLSNCKNKPK